MKLYKAKYADLLGILSSVLCFLHCLMVPVIWVLYSTYAHTSWHFLDYLFVVLAGVAVYFSAKNTPVSSLKIALWGSFLTFAVFLVFHEVLLYARYISLSASVALVFCHLINLKSHLQHQHSFAKAE